MGNQIGSVNVNADINPLSLFGSIIGFVLTIVALIGVGMFIYGITQLITAWQEKSSDALQKGLILCAAGLVMIGMRALLGMFGIIG